MLVIETFGLDDAIYGMTHLPPAITEELALVATMEGQTLLEEMRNYPPQRPPASRYKVYIRGEGWLYGGGATDQTSEQFGANVSLTTDVRQDSIEVTLSSGASYTVYIRGSLDENSEWYNRVAWMHDGNWEPVASMVEREIPKIEGAVDDALARVLSILSF